MPIEDALVVGCTADSSAETLAECRQLTHDILIRMLGSRRRSGVRWHEYDQPSGLTFLEDLGPEYENHRRFLQKHPGGALVVAIAKARRLPGEPATSREAWA